MSDELTEQLARAISEAFSRGWQDVSDDADLFAWDEFNDDDKRLFRETARALQESERFVVIERGKEERLRRLAAAYDALPVKAEQIKWDEATWDTWGDEFLEAEWAYDDIQPGDLDPPTPPRNGSE